MSISAKTSNRQSSSRPLATDYYLLSFALALFTGSLLLFLIQPMFAKMVLPLLGGSPAVWNTCMLFFQAVLLAGYAYAHLLPNWLGVRKHAILHLAVLLLPFLILPIHIPAGWTPPADSTPVFWLLALLGVAVGLPFFVVSTSAPLLQRWFAATDHPAGRDPYFLYSASNLGSMLGLLCYPLLLEPTASLGGQAQAWLAGYVLLVLMTALCVFLLRRSFPKQNQETALVDQKVERLTWQRRLGWVGLAFVPSSLMLSVTTYLTTDIAAIPLLWVIPLALYLLTFILAFAQRQVISPARAARVLPILILTLVLAMLSEATEPIALLVALHLCAFFVAALLCHGRLAADRPAAAHLTEFYFWLSVGGVVGGIFNALLAPVIFSSVTEYPIVLVLACLCRPESFSRRPSGPRGKTNAPNVERQRGPEGLRLNGGKTNAPHVELQRGPEGLRLNGALKGDLLWPIAVGILTTALVLGVQALGIEPGPQSVALMFAVPAVITYLLLHHPLRFALAIAALFLAGSLYRGVHGAPLYRERSFFGVHRVTLEPGTGQHRLVHGNTVHGRQDPEHPGEPLAYFTRSGPIGQVFGKFSGGRVAVVGLGAGSLAAYGHSGQDFTFFEIDPTVLHIAQDTRFFSFLHDSQASMHYVLGDARLTLQRAPDHEFDMLVIDAFSSDTIPLHLLTREALRIYLDKSTDNGLLAFNISNRYLDLEPVLAGLARDAGLNAFVQRDLEISDAERLAGKAPSIWVVMSRDRGRLAPLIQSARWQDLARLQNPIVWTDDFSNIFSVLKRE